MASRNTSSNRFLRPVFLFAGLVALAFKRLLYRPGLTLLALASIALAIGLVSSAGFFAQAVDRSVLSQELVRFVQQTGRPPFLMRVYFLPSSEIPLSLETTESLAPRVAATLEREIGLPPLYVGVEVESGAMMLHPAAGGSTRATIWAASAWYTLRTWRITSPSREPFHRRAFRRCPGCLDLPDHYASKPARMSGIVIRSAISRSGAIPIGSRASGRPSARRTASGSPTPSCP